jgi:hypothetical protein
MANKKCWKCGVALILGETWTQGQKNHSVYCCRRCVSQKSRDWEKANRERVNAKNRASYAADPELTRKKRAEYYQANKEKWQQYHKNWSQLNKSMPERRAKLMITFAKSRAKKFGVPFDLDANFILDRLKMGICEVTGIQFVLHDGSDGSKKVHPYSPSLDRIKAGAGYTKDNVRVVVYIYNIARSEYSDQQVLEFAKALVTRSNNS